MPVSGVVQLHCGPLEPTVGCPAGQDESILFGFPMKIFDLYLNLGTLVVQ